MYLTKVGFEKQSKILIEYEKVGNKLLMVTIKNEIQTKVPCYWRLIGNSEMPPLEIGVNYDNQLIDNITFFIKSTLITENHINEVTFEEGNVKIDTNVFTKSYTFIDIKRDYICYIHDNKLICDFSESSLFVQAYRADRLEIFLGEHDSIIGFAICDLSEKERKIINSL